jgi:hypothetical protein
MPRGIVVGARISSSGGFSMRGSVELEDLLKWILYWDEIVYAGIAIGGGSISGNQPADVQFLESAGVFRTEFVDLQSLNLVNLPPPVPGIEIMGLAGNQFAIASAAARFELSNRLSETTKAIWTIGQSGGESLLLPPSAGNADLLDIQLVDCLPVPGPSTSFEDVLEFKSRYNDELSQLRRRFDQLREQVSTSSDDRRATEKAIEEIVKSVADVERALSGYGVSSVKETVALYANNPSLTFWTSLGGIAAAASGFPVHVGLAAGMSVSTVCRFLHRTFSGASNLPENARDFAYVYEAARQLGSSPPNKRMQRTRHG